MKLNWGHPVPHLRRNTEECGVRDYFRLCFDVCGCLPLHAVAKCVNVFKFQWLVASR